MTDDSSHFPATRWTLLQALREGSEADAKEALESICKAYWTPLYIVARSQGMKQPDAEDSVQSFFESILKRDALLKADQSRGKLRTFLLFAFENFRKNAWRDSMRLKRGAGIATVSHSECTDAEERYLSFTKEGSDIATLYNREWARKLLARSLTALSETQHSRSLGERFDLYAIHLTQGGSDETTALSAAKLGISDSAFRQALFRLRRSYREKIEDELAVTLGTRDPEVIRQEMMDLFKAFE
jgi:RNA polymerase sigma-70 factor (ECF subfamily)